jgi:methionyl-tRNA formyltransferase
MKIVFFGSSDFGIPCLEYLVAKHVLCAVVTSPDRPKGRHLRILPGPVKTWALAHGVKTFAPSHLDAPDTFHLLSSFAPDFFVIASYGRIIPESLLRIPAFGGLNVHPSLLPKFRGPAPMEWTLIMGENITGISIIIVEKGVDTGNIIIQKEMPIKPDDDLISLKLKLAAIAPEALDQAIEERIRGFKGVPQSGLPSYARKLTKEDGHINWKRSSVEIANLVRGVVAWPGAFSRIHTPHGTKLLKIRRASVAQTHGSYGQPGTIVSLEPDIVVACGDGLLRIEQLQIEGKKELAAKEFLHGYHRILENACLR